MMLLLSVALAEPVPPDLTADELRQLLVESRQLTACRARESSHLDALDDCRARVLTLHQSVLEVTDQADDAGDELVAEVKTCEVGRQRCEQRRGRLRTVVVGVLSAAVAVVAWEAVR